MEDTNQTSLPEQNIPDGSAADPRPNRKAVVFVILLLLALGATGYWWHSTFTEDTDDAQISGHLIQVSSRVGGQIAKVNVADNQVVKAGDVIAELDARDYQVAVENAEAALASAEASAVAAQVNVPIITVNTGSNLNSANAAVSAAHAAAAQAQRQLESAQARVAQATANNVKAQADLNRYKPLVEKDVISRQQFDAAVAAADAAAAALADARAGQQAATEGIRVAHERVNEAQSSQKYAQTAPQQVAAQSARARQAMAEVKKAQAQLDQAKLNLSYTKILAPANGIITRKSVEINQNVAPAQNLVMLVSLDDLWVTANFKETQLRKMRAGQSAEIHVDSTGKNYQGRVVQIGGATGSVLSLFPPENATGNYVKVVQRVPVRIEFTNLASEDADHLLRPGFSVEPAVRVK